MNEKIDNPDQQKLTIQQAIDLGVQHHNAGDLPKAEGIYQQILEAEPNQPVVLRLLGTIALQVGKHDIAVDLIGKALAINPDDAEAHTNLGAVLKKQGKLDDAVASYHKALAINPDYAEVHCNLGIALQAQGKLDEAITCYEIALTINPEYIEAYYGCGNVLEMLECRETFEPQAMLDQCFSAVVASDYIEATRILQILCVKNPLYNARYVTAFFDRCCEALNRMIDIQQFDTAGTNIRWLYMLVYDHKPFEQLMHRYFEETKSNKKMASIEGHEHAIQLSMESQYFYQKGLFEEADQCASQCLIKTKTLLTDDVNCQDGWLLVQKVLKYINNPLKARSTLEHLLSGLE